MAQRLSFAALAGLFFLLAPPVADAAQNAGSFPVSLFFDDGEQRQIAGETRKAGLKPSGNGLHLGALVYYGPDNWTVWLQGERWTPATTRPGLQIRDVTPDHVRLSVASWGDDAPRDITLKPYQTYDPITGQIREGSE